MICRCVMICGSFYLTNKNVSHRLSIFTPTPERYSHRLSNRCEYLTNHRPPRPSRTIEWWRRIYRSMMFISRDLRSDAQFVPSGIAIHVKASRACQPGFLGDLYCCRSITNTSGVGIGGGRRGSWPSCRRRGEQFCSMYFAPLGICWHDCLDDMKTYCTDHYTWSLAIVHVSLAVNSTFTRAIWHIWRGRRLTSQKCKHLLTHLNTNNLHVSACYTFRDA